MNIIFMRHGEATDNVRELISDKEIYWSVLTENGKNSVQESIKSLPEKIDKIYVSPFPRTIETAHFVSESFPNTEVIIEERLHEIFHGKYSGQKNNDDLDQTRLKQIDGDFFVRFGEYGENKFDIELRLSSFLKDVYDNNFIDNTVLIVSHGSITSFMKRILNIKSPHIKTGKIEEFLNVDFTNLFEYIKLLKHIKSEKVKQRVKLVETLNISPNLKRNLIKIAKDFNNIEFSDEYLSNFTSGLATKNLFQEQSTKFDEGIILICFYNNFEPLVKKWMEHYLSIGIKNFVLVDNNSTDNSTSLLQEYQNKANISFWKIHEKYNCFKMCGWKQQILEFYGINKKYLIVDSDELFIYKDYNKVSIDSFLKTAKSSFIKSLMLDVYPKKEIFVGKLEEFNFVDKNTYKMSNTNSYGQRFYGGPRSRIFGINPSLQKISLITYTGTEVLANDHFYYPWNINQKAIYCSYLLHYKFLPEDKEKYLLFVKDGRHWNNSHEYKVYNSVLMQKKNITFYDKNISVSIDQIDFKF